MARTRSSRSRRWAWARSRAAGGKTDSSGRSVAEGKACATHDDVPGLPCVGVNIGMDHIFRARARAARDRRPRGLRSVHSRLNRSYFTEAGQAYERDMRVRD